LVYFSPAGEIVNVHRKLMPTGGERTVWGMGDGSTLGVVRTPFGVVGGLICWENYMPLARAALYAQGVDIYLAPTWDNDDVWVASMRHIAKEGRVYVVGVNYCLRGSDVPADVPGRDELYGGDDDWLARGNTAIVGPAAGGVEGDDLVEGGEHPVVHVRGGERDVAEHQRLERPQVGGIVGDVGAAVVDRPGPDLGDAKVVEGIVGEQRGDVARGAARPA